MEQSLLQNIRMFQNSAELVYLNKDYTSATMLYFKSWFVALDLLIFKKLKITPKDHHERFRILQKDFPNHYEMLDRYFPVYRSTYSATIDKKTCDEIRTYVIKTITENFGN